MGVGWGGWEYYDFQANEVPEMEAQRRALESQITQKQGELKRLQDFARNIEVIKQELRELNLQLEAALEHMPRQFNLSALLRKLTMLAQNSGLDLFTFKPAATEERGDTFYSTLTIDFELKGSFTQILLFLDQVARLKRIINAEDLRMVVVNNVANNASRGPTQLTVNSKVRTYRFSE
jgi:type IV pilus assembly protein PilO